MSKAISKYPNMDYYVHCGYCLVSSLKMTGFITVAGNLDDISQFPKEESLEIANHRIWIIHGHIFIKGDYHDY